MIHKGISLESIIKNANNLHEIKKTEVQPGDKLMITTNNSTYTLTVLGEGRYSVSGGWFDKQGLSPFITSVAGCTWGGCILKIDSIAACGLRVEFGNNVTTSIVKEITVIKRNLLN